MDDPREDVQLLAAVWFSRLDPSGASPTLARLERKAAEPAIKGFARGAGDSLLDAKRVHLGHTMKADGRWRLFAFAGSDDPAPRSRLSRLCEFLASSPDSPIRKYTAADADTDAVIDVRCIVRRNHRELAAELIPPFLVPPKGRYGLRDYEKVFCAEPEGEEDIFVQRGIDRDDGCIVIVRPDQFVANVVPLDGMSQLTAFFAPFMIAAGTPAMSVPG